MMKHRCAWDLRALGQGLLDPCSCHSHSFHFRFISLFRFDYVMKTALMSDMVVIRTFIREFARFKQLAEAGKVVELVDREGRRFTFAAEKPKRAYGTARHMAKGKPLSPDPIPREEWGENY